MFLLLSFLLLMCYDLTVRPYPHCQFTSFFQRERLYSHGNLAGNGRLLLAQRVEDAPAGSPCSLAGVAN
jgi:hypothetical protein